MVDVHLPTSRRCLARTLCFPCDDLVRRVATPGDFVYSFLTSFESFCESFSVTAERCGFRNLIPQPAYRQRLFLCGSAYFRASLHRIPFDDTASSSSIDGRTIRLFHEGNASWTFYVFALSAKHAAWGAIDLVFRIFLAGDHISQFSVTKSDSFPWSYPSATRLVGRLRSLVPPHAERKCATHFQMPDEDAGSLAHRRRSRG